MTSKNLFFNLMKENTKQRLWTVALISLIFFFAFPVQTALLISSYLSETRIDAVWNNSGQGIEQIKMQLQERFLEWAAIDNGMIVFLLMLFAVVCGLSGFAYLHSRKKTDFFHSIPVKREKLFAVVYINGFLYTAVPYLISLLISSVMIQIKAGQVYPWVEVFKIYAMHMSFFLLLYTVVIAAALLTGNTIVSVLGTAVFFLWGPGCVMLMLGYCTSYFVTFYGSQEKILKLVQKTSPAAWYIGAASAPEQAGEMAIWAVIAAAIVFLLCLMLYKKRPSEAAGRAMAFRISQPIIKLLLVLPMALTGSLLFKEMMGSDGWSLFGLVCGLVITYGIIEIIYNFDFRRLFAHKKEFALCAVCSAAVLAVFRFDLCGYDTYVPSEAKIESVGIYCQKMDADTLDDYLIEVEIINRHNEYQYTSWRSSQADELVGKMQLEDISPVVEIGRQGAGTAKELHKSHGGRRKMGWYSYGDLSEIMVAYHLKSGKTVLRQYYMNLSDVRTALDTIYSDKNYKEEVYPVLSYQASDIAGINYQEHDKLLHVDLKHPEMKEQILEAYQRELMNLTAETRRKESPVAAIQFKTRKMQDMIDQLRKKNSDYSLFNRKFYYPIYPSFTETIRLLKECGIEVGELLITDNVKEIVLEGREFRKDKEGKRRTITVTDKEKIQQILDSSLSYSLNCSNYLNDTYVGINVAAYALTEQEDSDDQFDTEIEPEAVYTEERAAVIDKPGEKYLVYYLNFDYDKIPEFVKEAFQLTEENMKDEVRWGY